MAYTALSHFNRVSMSVAGTERLIPDLGIDETAMGSVYSAYLIVYTLFMTPGGWFVDRVGSRAALLLVGFGAAACVALTGAVGLVPAGMMLGTFWVVRGLCGALNAPVFPSAGRAVLLWIPAPYRCASNGLITGAALLGIAASYPAFGWLMDHVGWSTAFVILGAATASVAVLWLLYGRDRPADHPGVNAAERHLIEGPVPRSLSGAAGGAAPAPWTTLLANRDLLLLTVSYAAVGYMEYLFFYWMEYYFKNVVHLSTETSRTFSVITSLATAAGMMLGGLLADRCQARFGIKRGRAMVPVAGMLAAAVMVVVGAQATEPTAVLLYFSLAMAAVGATEGPFWTTAIDLGGDRPATAGAIVNTGGNIGGFLAPVVTPLFAGAFGWKSSVVLAGVVSVLGALIWAGIDPSKPAKAGVRPGSANQNPGSQ